MRPLPHVRPHLRSRGERHPDITFAKVDTEAEQALAAAANITSIPTLMAFKDKTLVFSQPGALNATGLEEVIQAVKNLDMDKLRADAARQPRLTHTRIPGAHPSLLDTPWGITLKPNLLKHPLHEGEHQMLIERIYDEDLAQASYLIGCQAKGTAIVVDGRRDIAVYQDLAAKNGMKIVAVTETHIHADYLSGTRELAAATGAKIYVSGEGGPDWQYEFDGERLYDGDTITLGNITIQALHTPGHTPEHLSFLVTDGAFSDQPGYLLSGDFVFSGDLGRPDLLDEAAGGIDTRFEGAKQLFASLRDKFLTLPDYVQVHPAHGAGSACGKALGAIPSSTVGYERLYAWWGPYLAANDEQGFIDELLDGQPDAHAYFGRMKRENREGPAIMGERTPLPELAPRHRRSRPGSGHPDLHRHPLQQRGPRRHGSPFPERAGRQVRGQLRRLGSQPGNRQEPAGAPG